MENNEVLFADKYAYANDDNEYKKIFIFKG